jgi:site-specific DNA-methyltransferase (adenine-specific)
MTPYFNNGAVQIYHGDCRQIVPLLPPADLVIADPNYRETSLAWDTTVDGWLPVVREALAPHGSLWCFGSLSFFMRHAADFFAGWVKAQENVWEKHNGSGNHNDRFRKVHELLVHFYPKGARWSDIYRDPQYLPDETPKTLRHKRRPTHYGRTEQPAYASSDGGPKLMRSVIRVRSCHGRAVHPTQKPEDIVRPVLRYSCPPGGLVVSPFMGSGTDLVVAQQEGRRAVGVELDERNCELAARRLLALAA